LFIWSVDEEGEDEYCIGVEVRFTSVRAAGVILTKRGNFIEADKPLGSQIRTVVMNDGSPYETLHAYISMAVAPFFKSYLHETGRAQESASDKLAPSVEKKLVELEMGLLHLQQNIDIPEISLTIHPIVAQTVSTCAKENRRPKVVDFGENVSYHSSYYPIYCIFITANIPRYIFTSLKIFRWTIQPSSMQFSTALIDG